MYCDTSTGQPSCFIQDALAVYVYKLLSDCKWNTTKLITLDSPTINGVSLNVLDINLP